MFEVKGRIVFLDYMRIFAFLSVLIGHKFAADIAALTTDMSLHITIRCLAEIIAPFYLGGAAGIVVFFIISGYIITHVLQTEKPAEFLIKRVFRIYPLFIVAVFLEAFAKFIYFGEPFAPLSVWIPRLLLIGNLLGTPYSLGGVEWTLGIEAIFYLFMAGMKSLGVFRKFDLLPLLLVIASVILYFLPPIPGSPQWNPGYFNLYAPFLFIGTCFYLAETGIARRSTCITAIALIFFLFLMLIAKIQPDWKETNYAIFALLLFFSAMIIKNKLKDVPTVRFLSALTYSVYLFHNWAWDYLDIIVHKINFSFIPMKIQVLIALLMLCYFAHKTVELHGIKLGQIAISYYRKWTSKVSMIYN